MAIRVLVGTDGSELSRNTADFVVRLSKVLPLEVDLAVAVDLHPGEYRMVTETYEEMIREGAKSAAETTLQKDREYFQSKGQAVRTRILDGQAAPTLCRTASSEGHSLVVLGRKGEGGDIQDILFGSVSNWVVHHCKKPVLIVKGTNPIALREAAAGPIRVLVGVDESGGAQRALDFLGTIEHQKGLELTLLNVVDPEEVYLRHLPADRRAKALENMHQDAQALLDRVAKPLAAAGFPVTKRVEAGVPAKLLCRIYHEDAFEICVMGHGGHGELGDVLFGSVSNHVLHHCSGHVLMVP
jgi:nucleotide-binding universal stress UspA family protein